MTRQLSKTIALGLILSLPLIAQQAFDRSKIPAAGKTPVLHVPAWTKSKLANGSDLIISEKRDLPLVSFSITFIGGSNQFDAENRTGIASMTAAMMSEGTKTISVTAADVKRVANKYLTRGRVVLSIVPMGKTDQASKPAESKPVH